MTWLLILGVSNCVAFLLGLACGREREVNDAVSSRLTPVQSADIEAQIDRELSA